MNRYPLWKNLLILMILLVGAVYALPNLFGDDPAIQVSAGRTVAVDGDLVDKAESALKEAGLSYKGIELEDGRLLIRLTSNGDQLKAKDILDKTLGDDFIVALNLAPTTPAWLEAIGAAPMNLGLDLRGGVHFLMQVDMDAAIKQTMEAHGSDLRLQLRDADIRYRQIKTSNTDVVVVFRNEDDRTAAETVLRRDFPDLTRANIEEDTLPAIRLTLVEANAREIKRLAVQQNVTTLRNRINELGVAEPTVQQQGEDRIVV